MIIPPLLLPAEDAYTIENSVMMDRLTPTDLARGHTNAQADTSVYKKTFSGWYKRTALTGLVQMIFSHAINTSNRYLVWFDEQDNIRGYTQNLSDGTRYFMETATNFRDFAEWYHIVIATDTTHATQTERFKMYVNGEEIVDWTLAPLLAQNALTCSFLAPAAGTWTFEIGSIAYYTNGTQSYDGLVADFHCVDGQQLTASDFGEFDANGRWVAKEYTGTYGNNGFHLDFANSSDLGNDVSGNNNDFTATNLDSSHQYKDTPTNNYCILNSVDKTSYYPVEGGLRSYGPATGNTSIRGTVAVKGGKWYWESKLLVQTSTGTAGEVGIMDVSKPIVNRPSDSGGNGYMFGFGIGASNWYKRYNGTLTWLTSFTGTVSLTDVMNVAVDLDNGDMWVGKNGTWYNSGNPATGTNPTFTGIDTTKYYAPVVTPYNGGTTLVYMPWLNFGQNAFGYTPPSGFKTLCTDDLPEPDVSKSSDYFGMTTYAGNSANRSITGLDFQPDLVWIKNRSAAWSHLTFDSSRGAYKALFPDAANLELDYSTESLSSFNSDGFSLVDGTNRSIYNVTGNNYIAWNWKEGVTPGLDIVTYTGNGTAGRTVSHNLGVKPDAVIIKSRDSASYNWCVYHRDLGATKAIFLDLPNAVQTNNLYWNDTEPTSSVVTLGSGGGVNLNTDDYIMYAFAEVEGFSKIGTYTGNGSTDGAFIYCGFKPAHIMIKKVSTAYDWVMHDVARSPYNPSNDILYPSLANAEYPDHTSLHLDFVSTGVKLRCGNNIYYNGNLQEYIFLAFAESPFKYSRAA